MVHNLTDEDMDELLSSGRKFVKFSASWCVPCKIMNPILEELSERFTDVTFYDVDIEESPELAVMYAIMAVPTLFIIEDGEIEDVNIGRMMKGQLEEFING